MKTSLPVTWIVVLAIAATASCGGGRHEIGQELADRSASSSSGQAVAGTSSIDTAPGAGGSASGGTDSTLVAGGMANVGGGGGRDIPPSTGGSGGGAAGTLSGDGGALEGGAGTPGEVASDAPLSLAPPVVYRGGAWAMDIAVADLNGDGAADVASADFESPSGGAFVWLNRGDGTFDPASVYLPGRHGVSVAIGDLDGDSRPELVLGTEQDSNILYNDGAGAFSAPTPVATPGYGVRAIDANDDAKLDFLAGASLFLNLGGGKFETSPRAALGSPRVAADLNRDGRTDLVGAGGKVFVSLNTGGGKFALQADYATGATGQGSMVRGPAVGDVNHDGWPDIAAANDQDATASVLLNKGDGTFSLAHIYPTGSWPTAVALGDLNGDGWPELVVANSGVGTSLTKRPNYLAVYRNRGDGTFETPETFLLVEFAYSVQVADLNGDQMLDIVVGDAGGRLNVVLNTASR